MGASISQSSGREMTSSRDRNEAVPRDTKDTFRVRDEWPHTGKVVVIMATVLYVMVAYLWILVGQWLIAIGFALIFFLAVFAYFSTPGDVTEIRFGSTRFEAFYRRDGKGVEYGDVTIVRWIEDPGYAAVFVHLRNGDEVALKSISSELLREMLRRVGEARPDLLNDEEMEKMLREGCGTLEDANHKGKGEKYWKDRWRDNLGYNYVYWGRRPKK